jgi:hypothetical protein
MTDNTVPPPTPTDNLVGRVIFLVGMIALLTVGGIIALALFEKPIPDPLNTLAGAAVGGLTALMVGNRRA